jgi:hypothetical protein
MTENISKTGSNRDQGAASKCSMVAFVHLPAEVVVECWPVNEKVVSLVCCMQSRGLVFSEEHVPCFLMTANRWGCKAFFWTEAFQVKLPLPFVQY